MIRMLVVGYVSGTVAVAALQQLSPSIPVVFTVVTDPVAAGGLLWKRH